MNHRQGLLVLPYLLLSCTSTIDPADKVAGSWGTYDFDLTAASGSLILSNNCYSISFPLQAPLAYGDSFSVAGTVTVSSWAEQVGQQWRLTGVAARDTIKGTWDYLTVKTIEEPQQHWIPETPVTWVAGVHSDHSPVCPV